MNSILILLNGDLRVSAEISRLAKAAGMVVCADGGARHAAALKLQPRIVIGDMDSLPRKLPRWKETVFLCDFDQNISDFEKALRFVARRAEICARRRGQGVRPPPRRRGFRKVETGDVRAVYVAGATGGRLDHAMVNLALVEKYSAKLPLIVVDDCEAKLLPVGKHALPCRKGRRVTLLPATRTARVSTSGLSYPLKRRVLQRSSRGLGNRATASRLTVDVHAGRLWLIMSA